MIKKIQIFVASLALILLSSSTILAQVTQQTTQGAFGTVSPPPSVGRWGTLTAGGPVGFVNAIITFLTALAAVWLLITIVWSGINIIKGAKSPEDFYTQLKRIMWAIIGMILVAFAYVITGWVMTSLTGSPNLINNPLDQFRAAPPSDYILTPPVTTDPTDLPA